MFFTANVNDQLQLHNENKYNLMEELFLLFADNLVLLASSNNDLCLLLVQFVDEDQHLELWGRGAQLEEGGAPTSGQGGGPALSDV